MKTMCHPGCHHNGFLATYALGHMMYGYTLLAPMNQTVLNKLSKENNIKSIYIYIYIYIYSFIKAFLHIQSIWEALYTKAYFHNHHLCNQ